MKGSLARLLILVGLLCRAAAGGDPALVPPDPAKQLVLDARLIDSARNARLVLGTPVKDAHNPLFQADKPWENSLNNLYPNLLWDEEQRVFKLWYKCVLADKEAIAKMDRPSTVHNVGWYLLYATSKDGIRWEKPALGLHRFDGSADTNIVARDMPGAGVFKDMHETDPARRYKMVYDLGLGKPRVRFSADGLRWSDAIEVHGYGPRNGDTHNNALWDSRQGKYLWFTKLYLGERLVARFESVDFLHWKPGGMVLRSTVDEGRASQTYCMPVFRYGNLYLSYVMMYHAGKDRAVDCELAWSPDSVQWQRVQPGTPLIPRGKPGSYDSLCIYAPSGPPVAQDGQLLIYYGGDDYPHQGWKRHCLPCLARLRLDGFAGYEPREPGQPAEITTAAVRVVGDSLGISADVHKGSVRATVLGEDGSELGRSEPVSHSVTDGPVVWKNLDFTRLRGKTVRLRFEIDKARLYAFRGVELIHTAMPKPGLPPLAQVSPSSAPVLRVRFDRDCEHWSGLDKISHHASGGSKGGYVSVWRGGGLQPAAVSSAAGSESPLAGNWAEMFGANRVQVSFRAQVKPAGGKVQLEIFAKDIAQWSFAAYPELGSDWSVASTVIRPDWTDEQARQAGWRPAAHAFSWRDTMRHVGKLAIIATPGSPQESLDIDEFEVRIEGTNP